MKKTSKKYWFKTKTYGWGWYPATKEGWFVTFGILALIATITFLFPPANPEKAGFFFAGTLGAVSTLLSICKATGEKPKWRWGDD